MSDSHRHEGGPVRHRAVIYNEEVRFELAREEQAAADQFKILASMTMTNFKREALRQECENCLADLARRLR